MNFKEILLRHIKEYPLMEPTDAVKLAYQSAFGPAHLITDLDRAAEMIQRERDGGELKDIPPVTPIENGLVRLELMSKALAKVPSRVIARVFAASAAECNRDMASFIKKIEVIRSVTREGLFSFDITELDCYLSGYESQGYPAVSHSLRYKEAYQPSYRVINSRYSHLLPFLAKIEEALNGTSNAPILLAIDGHAAAGKTTLSELLASLYDCNIFHMDDFFLPPALRTKERLGEIGGNVHYERFCEEILTPVKEGVPFSYSVFDCSVMAINGTRSVEPKRLNIVEGSYSQHPYFWDCYDIRVFMDIDPDEQMKRINTRNGQELAEKFRDIWIPMENRYFDAFAIKKKSDIILSNDVSV